MDISMKTTDTLIKDIYKLMQNKTPDSAVDVEAAIDSFGEACKDLMRKEFGNSKNFDSRKLRMSNIGKNAVTYLSQVHVRTLD
jgi:hypothetical protein